MFTCGPALFASSGPPPDPDENLYYITLTIPTGKVASDLTDFPVMVDLAGMPSAFWSHVKSDGGDVRVVATDGTTQIPMDLAKFDYAGQGGWLFFKRSIASASDTIVRIYYGASGLDLLPPADTYGMHACWTDYHRVTIFSEPGRDRSGHGQGAIPFSEPDYLLSSVSVSSSLGTHVQGVSWDGTYYYVSEENSVYLGKYDASWALVASNSDPIGSASASPATEMSSCEVHAGILYVCFTAGSGGSPRYLAAFNTSDLSFIAKYDISALGAYGSGLAYNPDDGYLWLTNFWDGGADIKRITLLGVYVDTITLSRALVQPQGITFPGDGYLYITSVVATLGRVWQVAQDGLVRRMVYETATSLQGMGKKGSNLLVIDANCVRELQWPTPSGVSGWLNQNGGAGHARAYGLTKYGTWTIGASAVMAAKGANRPVASYTDADSSIDPPREALGFNNTADRWGMWNSTDLWLTGGTSPSTSQLYRLNMVKNGTTNRTMWIDGALVGTDTGTSARPTSVGDGLYIGASHSGSTAYSGRINFVYVRAAVLSANWLAAEASNWHTPSGFYTIGSEQSA